VRSDAQTRGMQSMTIEQELARKLIGPTGFDKAQI
jgi:hypothetical protein